jgi:hypothetical protein
MTEDLEIAEHFILDDKLEPVLEPDREKWAKWMEANEQSIARTRVGEHLVSTFFLGKNFGQRTGQFFVFSTLITAGKKDDERFAFYASRDAAISGHDQHVAMLRDSETPQD